VEALDLQSCYHCTLLVSSDHSNARSHLDVNDGQELVIPLTSPNVHHIHNLKDREHLPASEPDTPVRSPRWLNRLDEGSFPQPPPSGLRIWYGETGWKPGVKIKLVMGLSLMWMVNVMWSYP
jgi:hypothetical protein